MTALPRLARLLAVLLVAPALAVAAPGTAPASTVGSDGRPITNQAGATIGIAAHRGGRYEWPENSLEAFTGSVRAGFDVIETDIVFTRDGHGVFNHDDKLRSRCTYAGYSIHRMPLAQVSKVRCADRAGRKVVPIPTFEQLAGLLAAHEQVGLALDIKTYSGQSASGKRSWAARALKLVSAAGLLERTSVISFNWSHVLPTIRAQAPGIRVLALDYGPLNLGRVRLAARLGANAYGTRMRETSAYLASYVKAEGMDSEPWAVSGVEQREFTIAYGGRRQFLMTDQPTSLTAQLVGGAIEVNPVPVPTTTTLRAPATISSTTYRANQRHYPTVGTRIVPSSALPMLQDVTLSVTVAGGTGTGTLSVGAGSSPVSSSTTVALPKGTATLTVRAPLGDGRRLRIYTTATVKLTVKVVAYTRVRFT